MPFSGASFDSATLELMEQVFDDVCEKARCMTPNQPWPDDVASAVAIRILAAVAEGERDQDRLKLWALNAIDARNFLAPGKPA